VVRDRAPGWRRRPQILLTTHYLEEADRLARRLAIVDQGRVVAESAPDDLKAELRGDAIVVELGEQAHDGEVTHALATVDDLHDVAVEARTLRAGRERRAHGPHGARGPGGGQRRRRLRHGSTPLTGRCLPASRRPRVQRGRCGGEEAMNSALVDSWYMTVRHMRNLFRQSAWLAISLIQPVVWLLLYGALCRKIIEIPGFGPGSYIDFLTPGIVVMTVRFSAGWSGMGLIDDINRGVVDRFLVPPTSRGSLIWGRLIRFGLVAVVQSAIIIELGLILGAHYPSGMVGMLVLVLAAVLLGTGFGGLSNAIAVLSRREETMIAASNFIILPLTFLSSVFMAQTLMPAWMQSVARYNPVNWAVQACREALVTSPDRGMVDTRLLALAVFAVVFGWLATRLSRVSEIIVNRTLFGGERRSPRDPPIRGHGGRRFGVLRARDMAEPCLNSFQSNRCLNGGFPR